MNTRIQVEHTVTEMISGNRPRARADSRRVRRRAHVRSGDGRRGIPRPRDRGADQRRRSGARLPPGTRHAHRYEEPGGFGVRVDSAAFPGFTISPDYDSMIAKLIVWARDAASVAASRPGDRRVPHRRRSDDLAALAGADAISRRSPMRRTARRRSNRSRPRSRRDDAADASGDAAAVPADETIRVEVNDKLFRVRFVDLPAPMRGTAGRPNAPKAPAVRKAAPQGNDVVAPMHGVVVELPVAEGATVGGRRRRGHRGDEDDERDPRAQGRAGRARPRRARRDRRSPHPARHAPLKHFTAGRRSARGCLRASSTAGRGFRCGRTTRGRCPAAPPPGTFPFTRGIRTDMYRGRHWTMRQYAGFATAAESNARYRYLLARRAFRACRSRSICRRSWVTTPTHRRRAVSREGRGSDRHDRRRRDALRRHSARRRDGFDDDQRAGRQFCSRLVLAVARRRGIPFDRLRGTGAERRAQRVRGPRHLHLPARPLDAFGHRSHGLLLATTFRTGTRSRSRATTFARPARPRSKRSPSGSPTRRRTCGRRFAAGLPVDAVAPRISFFWNAHNDFFEEVAKFRAARTLWAEIVRDDFGSTDPRSQMLRFQARPAAPR